jgi:predicted component of type VI protein secretion system
MENMKKLFILSCVLLLAMALLVSGCKKKEDASDKEQKSEVKVSAEETVKASEEKTDEISTEKVAEAPEKKADEASAKEATKTSEEK